MTTYELPRESWLRPQGDVWACFELNGVDAPILLGAMENLIKRSIELEQE